MSVGKSKFKLIQQCRVSIIETFGLRLAVVNHSLVFANRFDEIIYCPMRASTIEDRIYFRKQILEFYSVFQKLVFLEEQVFFFNLNRYYTSKPQTAE